MLNQFQKIFQWIFRNNSLLDFFVLAGLAVFAVFNPYYLYQNINLFELGLYLPGIGSVLDGQIPYRDFFHLRGPFELYVPALMMKVWGEHVAVLSTYFYVGNVLCLIVCMGIAYRVLPNRWIFYCFVPVMIARTYPRVVYTYWGGFRYVWGLLAIYCLVEFLLRKKKGWIFTAGLLTALAGLTSVEVGVSAVAAAIVIILLSKKRLNHLLTYVLGISILAVPYLIYLSLNGALGAYFHSQWLVATQMTKTFLQTEPVPSNILEVLAGLLNPGNKNFRQMTPVYCYVFFSVYLWFQHKNKRFNLIDLAVSGIAVYGFMLYVTGFRNLWASVFEMSLQPEKIVLFYLLFNVVTSERSERSNLSITKIASSPAKSGVLAMTRRFLIAAVILSSVGYSFDRLNKRFLFFRHQPFKNEKAEFIQLPRIHGMKVPEAQAQDLNGLSGFIEDQIPLNEKVWMYPELGAMQFILNRPFIGKYPTATLTWMDEEEYAQYMKDLTESKPRYAIVNKETPEYFEKSYFSLEKNVLKYKEQMNYLNKNYSVVYSTPNYNIYLNNKN